MWGPNNDQYDFGGSLLELWHNWPQNPFLIIKAPILYPYIDPIKVALYRTLLKEHQNPLLFIKAPTKNSGKPETPSRNGLLGVSSAVIRTRYELGFGGPLGI